MLLLLQHLSVISQGAAQDTRTDCLPMSKTVRLVVSTVPDNLSPPIREEDPVLPSHHAAVTVLVLAIVEPLLGVRHRPPVVVWHARPCLGGGVVGDAGGGGGLLGVVGETLDNKEEEGEGEEEGLTHVVP